MSTFATIAGLVIAFIALVAQVSALNNEQRSRFVRHAWISLHWAFVIGGTLASLLVIYVFWAATTPPTRHDIVVLIIYVGNLVLLPKSLIDEHVNRLERVRDSARNALYDKILLELRGSAAQRVDSTAAT